MAKFDPFLSLDSAPTPSTLAQSKDRKGSNFAIWQPCSQGQSVQIIGRLGRQDTQELAQASEEGSNLLHW